MNRELPSIGAESPLLEESAEELYEHAPCGYLSALADGTIVKVNETLLSWLGYSRDEILDGRRFQDLLPVGGKVFHDTHYAPLLQLQGFANEIAFDLTCRDGKRLPVLLNARVRREAASGPSLIRTTIFNATDRRTYERELLHARRRAEAAARTKAEFVSTISHELRTPLGNIFMVAELLAEGEILPAQAEPLRILRSACENLRRLVDDVLDLSKLEASKLELDERPFDLRTLVSEVIDAGRVRAIAKNLELRVELAPDLPATVIGDRSKLGQVLTNLVGNAVKFTAKGSVTVAVLVLARKPDVVRLELRVSDTGIGIPAERLPHIFDEYSQVSASTQSEYGGTGLGLPISQRLVQLHGSRIQVESEPGVGSTFSFQLRLRRPAAPLP